MCQQHDEPVIEGVAFAASQALKLLNQVEQIQSFPLPSLQQRGLLLGPPIEILRVELGIGAPRGSPVVPGAALFTTDAPILGVARGTILGVARGTILGVARDGPVARSGRGTRPRGSPSPTALSTDFS